VTKTFKEFIKAVIKKKKKKKKKTII